MSIFNSYGLESYNTSIEKTYTNNEFIDNISNSLESIVEEYDKTMEALAFEDMANSMETYYNDSILYHCSVLQGKATGSTESAKGFYNNFKISDKGASTEGVKEFFKKAWEAIKAFFRKIGEWFKNMFKKIKEFFTGKKEYSKEQKKNAIFNLLEKIKKKFSGEKEALDPYGENHTNTLFILSHPDFENILVEYSRLLAEPNLNIIKKEIEDNIKFMQLTQDNKKDEIERRIENLKKIEELIASKTERVKILQKKIDKIKAKKTISDLINQNAMEMVRKSMTIEKRTGMLEKFMTTLPKELIEVSDKIALNKIDGVEDNELAKPFIDSNRIIIEFFSRNRSLIKEFGDMAAYIIEAVGTIITNNEKESMNDSKNFEDMEHSDIFEFMQKIYNENNKKFHMNMPKTLLYVNGLDKNAETLTVGGYTLIEVNGEVGSCALQNPENDDYIINISVRTFGKNEEERENIVLHEMCHILTFKHYAPNGKELMNYLMNLPVGKKIDLEKDADALAKHFKPSFKHIGIMSYINMTDQIKLYRELWPEKSKEIEKSFKVT